MNNFTRVTVFIISLAINFIFFLIMRSSTKETPEYLLLATFITAWTIEPFFKNKKS